MASGAKIENLSALECLDSRGFPTLQVSVSLQDGSIGSAMVPSGASTGEFEALELRDNDSDRFFGKGVLTAVKNVEERIRPALKGSNVLDLAVLDQKMIELDGTENKSNLGANAILGVSLAAAHAGAAHRKIPLFQHLGSSDSNRMPVPLVNVINGGAHAANSLDFQEFMLVPHGLGTFHKNIRAAAEIFQALKKRLDKERLATAVGDEGGFAPNLTSSEQALELLCDSIVDAGYEPGKDVALALDVAASELYDKASNSYVFKKSSGDKFAAADLISLYEEWCSKFPLVSIEDGLDENDWEGWQKLTERLGERLQLVGDDLFVTNVKRIEMGIERAAGNAILIKLNQIGTVTETLEAIKLGRENNLRSVISHRSGETEDTTIADLAVAVECGQIKTGSVCRSERTAKYNRLLWIESYLGDRAVTESPFTS